MTNNRIQELFESYFHYWVIKLNLHKKYKFTIKKDNRLTCYAWVEKTSKNHYEIKFNSTELKSQYKIINVVLHEIGHLFVDWRSNEDILHEAEAEYFALSTMKENYPKFYKLAIKWTKQQINDLSVDEAHRQGYINALQRLNEFKNV